MAKNSAQSYDASEPSVENLHLYIPLVICLCAEQSIKYWSNLDK